MQTADFDFELPPELIAQTPASKRDASRLLVLHRDSDAIEHRTFRDLLEFLRPGDVLVLNNSRVIPARLRGRNAKTGGAFEILLLEENAVNDWWAMLRPAKRARIGTEIVLGDRSLPHDRTAAVPGRSNMTNQAGQSSSTTSANSPSAAETRNSKLETGNATPADSQTQIANRQSPIGNLSATILHINPEGHRRLQFTSVENILDLLDTIGEIPLPPYIHRDRGAPDPTSFDRERYQTVFAQPAGSVAAPTAGLHFTQSLLDEIRARGIEVHFVTLHVGPGTFLPVKTETIAAHTMHEERYDLSEATAHAINTAKREGRRVIAVGTTTVRVLETAARNAEICVRSNVNDQSAQSSSTAGTTSPSPIASRRSGTEADGWERAGVRANSQTSANALSPHATDHGPLTAGESLNPQHKPLSTSFLTSGRGRTRIFIYPPAKFKIVDALLTNFHLPRSTLLMLISAFASPGETRGREKILAAYAEAIRERYRFFSYGDAMLIE